MEKATIADVFFMNNESWMNIANDHEILMFL